MAATPTNDDAAAFTGVRKSYITLMSAVIVYVLLAWVLLAFDAGPQRELNNQILWLTRGGLAVLSVAGQFAVGLFAPIPNTEQRPEATWFGRVGPTTDLAVSRIVLRGALSEAVGIYGLLIFVIGGHLADVLAFCAAALVALAWHFPTRDRWDLEVERTTRGLSRS